MPQVHRHPLVPVVGRDGIKRVPVVAGGVVDQHLDRAVGRGRRRDGAAQLLDVAHVASGEERAAVTSRGDRLGELIAAPLVDVAERDLRTLRAKVLDDRGADAGAAAADEHRLALEARIDRPGWSCALPVVYAGGRRRSRPAAAQQVPTACQGPPSSRRRASARPGPPPRPLEEPMRLPSALIIEVMKFDLDHLAQHQAEDRRGQREAVLLHQPAEHADDQHDADPEHACC